FAGWCDHPAEALAQLDLLVVPSTGAESSTRVILEAFAAGVPVLASATGGIPEIVCDGVNGLLTPPRDIERLAEGMSAALTAPPERLASLARAARSDWRERYTVERYRETLLAIIEKAAASARR